MSAQPESEGGSEPGKVGEDAATADGRTSTRSRAAQWRSAALASQSIRAGIAILLVGFISLDVVLLLALAVGIRGSMWFPDATALLTAFVGFLITVAVSWDVLLLLADAVRAIFGRLRKARGGTAHTLSWWRRRGFFSIGVWPLPFLIVTIYFLIATSNVSSISLKLLESTTTWRDAFYWGLEESLLVWVTKLPIHVPFWETIYNSGWNVEMLTLFAIIIINRSPYRPAAFCLSFTLLFYLGRLIGLASPVMGPAFYQTEHFLHLKGSITALMMARVYVKMSGGGDVLEQGAAILGGVGAMPSLHVGMIGLAAYWLIATRRWTWVVALPWLVCVWVSTVLLGWHYVLDGVGGLALAALCIALTYWILDHMGVRRAPQ